MANRIIGTDSYAKDMNVARARTEGHPAVVMIEADTKNLGKPRSVWWVFASIFNASVVIQRLVLATGCTIDESLEFLRDWQDSTVTGDTGSLSPDARTARETISIVLESVLMP